MAVLQEATASALRAAGGAAYREARFADAEALYSEALEAAGAQQQGSTLLSNRAACRLKLRRWRQAEEDCSAALAGKGEGALNAAGRAKALFRRATAREALQDVAGAARDLAACLADEPGNEAAKAAAQRIRKGVQDRASLAEMAVTELKAAGDDLRQAEQRAEQISGDGAGMDAAAVAGRAALEALTTKARNVGALLVEGYGDSLAAAGGVDAVVGALEAINACSSLVAATAEASRALAGVLSMRAREDVAGVFKAGAAAQLVRLAEAEAKRALGAGAARSEEGVLARVGHAWEAVAAVLAAAQQRAALIGDKDNGSATIEGVDALVQACIDALESAAGAEAAAHDVRRRVSAAALRALAAGSPSGAVLECAMRRLPSLTAAASAGCASRRAVAATLARILAAGMGDDNRAVMVAAAQRLVTDPLLFWGAPQPGVELSSQRQRSVCAALAALIAIAGIDGKTAAEAARSSGALAHAFALATAGPTADGAHGGGGSAEGAQALSADLISTLASSREGLAVLSAPPPAAVGPNSREEDACPAASTAPGGGRGAGGKPTGRVEALDTNAQGALGALLQSPSDSVRAAAVVAMVKLAASQAGGAHWEGDEGIADICLGLLDMHAEVLEGADGDSSAGDAATAMAAEFSADEWDDLPRAERSAAAERREARIVAERAVEALCYLGASPVVKRAVVSEEGALECICGLVRRGRLRGAVLYGAAALLGSLSASSEEQLQAETLAGETEHEDLSPEDAEMLRKAAGMGRAEPTDADRAADEPEALRKRKLTLACKGGAGALVAMLLSGTGSEKAAGAGLAAAPNSRLAETAAEGIFHLASEPAARAPLVSAGALPALLRATRGGSKRAALLSSHAVARLLISTNPALVADATLLDCAGPLVRLIQHDYALQQFEGLLALTNLASAGYEYKCHVADVDKGAAFSALEELQWGRHPKVARAATECLANLIPAPKVIAELKKIPARLRAWLELALPPTPTEGDEGREYDPAAASAAAGGLAMAAGEEGVTAAMFSTDDFAEGVVCLLTLGPGMAHRAAALCAAALAVAPEECREKLSGAGAKAALRAVLECAKGDSAWCSAAGAATDALSAF